LQVGGDNGAVARELGGGGALGSNGAALCFRVLGQGEETRARPANESVGAGC